MEGHHEVKYHKNTRLCRSRGCWKNKGPQELPWWPGKKGGISHVGFSCGGYDLIHSQGCVKKESLDKNSPNYNKSLLDIYLSSASTPAALIKIIYLKRKSYKAFATFHLLLLLPRLRWWSLWGRWFFKVFFDNGTIFGIFFVYVCIFL